MEPPRSIVKLVIWHKNWSILSKTNTSLSTMITVLFMLQYWTIFTPITTAKEQLVESFTLQKENTLYSISFCFNLLFIWNINCVFFLFINNKKQILFYKWTNNVRIIGSNWEHLFIYIFFIHDIFYSLVYLDNSRTKYF